MKSLTSNLLSQPALIESVQDLELAELITEISAVFPNWDLKALHGEDPEYSEEVGENQARLRVNVQSFDKALKILTTKRKEVYETLQDTCAHNYVAEVRAKPNATYSHEKYDIRICEVCGLYENGPGATYNLYSDLSDVKLGRVLLRRVDRDEYRKIEKLTQDIVTV